MSEFTRRIRSFVLRQGKMTVAQKRDYELLIPKYGLQLQTAAYDFATVFANAAPLVLEIGFGMGHAFVAMAAANPDYNFIGIEVHTPGVATALREVERLGLANVRFFHEDAVLVLQQCIADAALARVNIFFPDPWHKKKHNKRRLVQVPFLQALAPKVQAGGLLHLATDWAPYAEWMLEECAASECWQRITDPAICEREFAMRLTTKFERRGERLGHSITDLLYEKR